jgi:hypothetical protein
LGSYDTSTYLGSGPFSPEVKPLLPALLFILCTRWLARLLELYCLVVEEKEFDLPTLRVQPPLYRQGHGYSLASGWPAAGFLMATVLAWAPPSSGLCLGAGCFIKRHFPLDKHIRSICLLSASDPFMEEGLAHCGYWRSSVAGVTLVFGLYRSYRVHVGFNKRLLEGFRRLHRLRPPVVKTPAGCWRSRSFG